MFSDLILSLVRLGEEAEDTDEKLLEWGQSEVWDAWISLELVLSRLEGGVEDFAKHRCEEVLEGPVELIGKAVPARRRASLSML
jgi:hypothetical protein